MKKKKLENKVTRFTTKQNKTKMENKIVISESALSRRSRVQGL